MGTETVRPSTRSTIRVSLVTWTLCARACPNSVGEEVIPRLSQVYGLLHHQLLNFGELRSAEPDTLREANRVEPELRPTLSARYMDVSGFLTIGRIEEESVGAGSENRRH